MALVTLKACLIASACPAWQAVSMIIVGTLSYCAVLAEREYQPTDFRTVSGVLWRATNRGLPHPRTWRIGVWHRCQCGAPSFPVAQQF